MKYHQLRVAALHNCFGRPPRGVDAIALHLWHLWAVRGDIPKGTVERWKHASDIELAMLKLGPRTLPLRSSDDAEYSSQLERRYEADHIRSYRETYFTRSNLL